MALMKVLMLRELSVVVLLEGTTKGCGLLDTVKTTLNSRKLNLNNISGVITDGAPSMCGKSTRFSQVVTK